METLQDNKKAVKAVAKITSGENSDRQFEMLCERLLRIHPQSEPLLKRLLARSHRERPTNAFAPIRDGRRCSACNMTVASARLQKAKAGEFINCANCITFLYYEEP
jgi:predicted  nucleic acid-binding Zn-ribbon protein